MRIAFAGTPEFARVALERLLDAGFDVALVLTQPDRPAGRGLRLQASAVKTLALARGLPLAQPRSLRLDGRFADDAAAAHGAIEAAGVDALVVAAYGLLLPASVLRLPPRGCLNIHASLLPRWRGAAPINHAILVGDEESGNSVITLADRMDAGLVLGQSRRKVLPLLTAGDLHDKLSSDGPDLVIDVLKKHASGTLTPVTQDESKVTLAGKFSKADSWVDFSDEAEPCRRRINGLNPWPGVAVTVGGVEVKLLRALAESEPSGKPVYHSGSALPGEVLDKNQGLIACGEATVLRVLEVQPAGKKPMAWHSFVMGHNVNPGDRLLCNSRS